MLAQWRIPAVWHKGWHAALLRKGSDLRAGSVVLQAPLLSRGSYLSAAPQMWGKGWRSSDIAAPTAAPALANSRFQRAAASCFSELSGSAAERNKGARQEVALHGLKWGNNMET